MPNILMHWDYILILALLAVFVPWRSNARIRALLDGPPLGSFDRIQVYFSTILLQWLITALVLWRTHAHQLGFADLAIALPRPSRAIAAAALLTIALVLNQVFALRRIASLPMEQRGIIPRLAERLLPRSPSETLPAVALVFSVAICEEVIYRGFAQTIFQDAVYGSLGAGAVLSALLFALAHLYQGKKGILTTSVVGLIFSCARLWTGSIIPGIFVHFCVDFSAGVVLSRLEPLQIAIFNGQVRVHRPKEMDPSPK